MAHERKGSILRRMGAILVSVSLLTAVTCSTAFAADDIDTLKAKQAQLAQAKQENDAKLAKLRSDKSDKQAYKETLTNQIATLQDQIDTYNAQIENLDAQIVQAQNAIAEKQKSILSDTEKLKQRLRAIYMSGGASNLEVLLSADSMVDLADRTEALQTVTEHDTALIDNLKSEMASVKEQKDSIEKNRKEAAEAKTAVDDKQDELKNLETETQSVIDEMSSTESDLQSTSEQLAKQEDEAAAAVDKWMADYQASQERARIAAQQEADRQKAAAQSNSSSSTNASSDDETSESESSSDTGSDSGSSDSGNSSNSSDSEEESGGSSYGTGSYQWPVPSCSSISSGFGSRWGTTHKGIDIPGSYGASIVAADSGTVIQAGFGVSGSGYGGYGNVVAIDHGNGVVTMYAHMSRVAVSAGSTVAKGQVIGYVGSTGQSTGNHCHFEVRVNGTAVNPLNYV